MSAFGHSPGHTRPVAMALLHLSVGVPESRSAAHTGVCPFGRVLCYNHQSYGVKNIPTYAFSFLRSTYWHRKDTRGKKRLPALPQRPEAPAGTQPVLEYKLP